MPLPTANLLILSAAEGRELLAASQIGRVVTSVNAMPAAFPVNYSVVDDAIVFRTGLGAKLAAALDGTVVAFEVDDIDAESRSGWSVLAVGWSAVVDEADELAVLEASCVRSWAGDDLPYFVKIAIETLSGRRILPAR